ncbi:hypothetical protein GCM10018790_70170 [Kitasatospora xanthocidica]|uniref:DUF4253 domain-containing protein n=1 Tax=Kitasatospora xanthocidica TaxID=83382 RepID=UPI001678C716|nr:DUF4253 domain-containing protein [Kitasatospora xanthocidica]GHF82397.1 hypothetical protein GCM10018790_70170 [Kitasatospora xanthocidica]
MTQPLDLAGALAALPVALPPGRLVGGEDGREPLLWVSDAPAPGGLWARLHRAHPDSGLWPLLLSPLDRGGPDFRPWLSGELYPSDAGAAGLYDPAALLRTWWETGGEDGDDRGDDEELAESLAPYGLTWPGPAPAVDVPAGAAGVEARGLADVLQSVKEVRLGLVRADSGAEALAVCGWSGPANHEDDIAKVAAVLADWERRFGAQVVEVGFDTLELSVPVPPATLAEALPLAAEHTSLCPDLVFQGTGSLAEYAEGLVGAHQWSFWWD